MSENSDPINEALQENSPCCYHEKLKPVSHLAVGHPFLILANLPLAASALLKATLLKLRNPPGIAVLGFAGMQAHTEEPH